MAVSLLCCSTPLLAQTTADSANTAPPVTQTKPAAPWPATAHITGTVFCNDTHRPARGAMVMVFHFSENGPIQPAMGPMARVATDGTYSIDHLRPGNYTVIALLPGYLSPLDELPLDQDSGNNTQMRDILTRNGVVSVRDDETANMDITITRGATLSGHVAYSDGAPATQAQISIEEVSTKPPQNPGGPFRNLLLHQSQGTNDEGNFRISGLRPGTYHVAAVLPSPGQSSEADSMVLYGIAAADTRSLRVYSDDTLHKNAAKTYELRAGDEITGVEITIPVYAFHRVEGHLTAIDGRPIIVAAIALTDASDDSFALHSRPTIDGEFVFPEVPAGTYNLAIVGARLGTLPYNTPPDSAVLQNAESFADKTTTVLVKDSDVTDLSIQLTNTPPAANQSATPAASSQ